jgi:hypothetical protein
MNTPPATGDLDLQDLARIVARHWGLDVAHLTYLPLGFGSHHWLAEVHGATTTAWFVTADRVAPGSVAERALHSALSAAWHLRHRAGIEEVVAPLQHDGGDILVPVNARWVAAVYPHHVVEASAWGAFGREEDRLGAQRLVARIHAVDPATLPPGSRPTEDFTVPYRTALFQRLDATGDPWTSGPYAERTRAMLQHHAERIRAGFARYDALVAAALASHDDWVITHGEPHAGNMLRQVEAPGMLVVDWDTCAIAPRERDLWQLLPPDQRDAASLAAYLEAAGLPMTAVSTDRLALYRLRWDLAEIAIYAHEFFHPHEDTEDARVGWGGLESSLDLLARHLG